MGFKGTLCSHLESSPSSPTVADSAYFGVTKLLLQYACGLKDLGPTRLLTIAAHKALEIEFSPLLLILHSVYVNLFAVEATLQSVLRRSQEHEGMDKSGR